MKTSDNREMAHELEKCRALVEEKLSGYFIADNEEYSELLESMRYSLLAGGKRIRAVICIKFCEAAGGKAEAALDAACAIEMLHAYTLIHDDLPCMDDSGMRRGKPSNHIKFGEFTAMLAGDALQAVAFETVLGSALPSDVVLEMAGILAKAASAHGVCGGQFLDLHNVNKQLSVNELTVMHSLKTAALISASARIGVVAAGGTQYQINAAAEYANAIGLAFQVRDDLLDMTANAELLGKPTGSDMRNSKTTYANLMGTRACENIIQSETDNAIRALKDAFDNTTFLECLAHTLAERER